MAHRTVDPREQLVSAEEIAELFGISSRMVLTLPLRQYRIGPRTVRFRLSEVLAHFGLSESERL